MIDKTKELKLLSREELSKKWFKIFKIPPPAHLSKPYLIKHIAWQSEFNCLPANTQKQINKLVEQYSKTRSINKSDIKMVQKFEVTTGTRFIREFNGKKHEVTALDKVAASKKKGMWMGGRVPIGYLTVDKKLEIDQIHSESIKIIFDEYLKIKSVGEVRQQLQDNNIKSKSGLHFSKGNLHNILTNKIYVGLVTHKDKVYAGEHEAIIDDETFEKVQKLLLHNRVDKKCNTKSASSSLLAGKIYDDKNNKMSPSHSNTKNKRYRYYVSQAVIKGQRAEAGSITKIPAGEIEKFLADAVKEFLLDREKMQNHLKHFDIAKQKAILATVKNINNFSEPKLLRAILNKVIIGKTVVEITLCEKALIKMLENLSINLDPPEETKSETDSPIVITKEVKITKTAQSGNVLIIGSCKNAISSPNPYLVNAIVKSHYWHKLILESKVKSIAEIQKLEGMNDPSYIKDIMKLKFIPAEITEQILNGIQPIDMTVRKLLAVY